MRRTSEVSEEYVDLLAGNSKVKCSKEQKYTVDITSKLVRKPFLVVLNSFKGIVNPEMKIYCFSTLFSVEHKRRLFISMCNLLFFHIKRLGFIPTTSKRSNKHQKMLQNISTLKN